MHLVALPKNLGLLAVLGARGSRQELAFEVGRFEVVPLFLWDSFVGVHLGVTFALVDFNRLFSRG